MSDTIFVVALFLPALTAFALAAFVVVREIRDDKRHREQEAQFYPPPMAKTLIRSEHVERIDE